MTTSLTIFVIIHQLGRQDAEIQTKVEELNKSLRQRQQQSITHQMY